MKESYLYYGAYALAGAAVGAVGSYLITRHVISKKYEKIIDQEISAARDHYTSAMDMHLRANKEGPYESAESAAQELIEKQVVKAVAETLEKVNDKEMEDLVDHVVKMRYIPSEKPDEHGEVEAVEIGPDGLEIDNEYVNLADVQPPRERQEFPFVITEREYYEDEPRHSKETLIYYVDDDVLADKNDMPVPDIAYSIGAGTLDEFEGGIVETIFVRNDRTSTDFEVILNAGSYTEQAFGQTDVQIPEAIRKMRRDW